jgi:hypothetical protein
VGGKKHLKMERKIVLENTGTGNAVINCKFTTNIITTNEEDSSILRTEINM